VCRALHLAADDTTASQPGWRGHGSTRWRQLAGAVVDGLASASSAPVGKSTHAV